MILFLDFRCRVFWNKFHCLVVQSVLWRLLEFCALSAWWLQLEVLRRSGCVEKRALFEAFWKSWRRLSSLIAENFARLAWRGAFCFTCCRWIVCYVPVLNLDEGRWPSVLSVTFGANVFLLGRLLLTWRPILRWFWRRASLLVAQLTFRRTLRISENRLYNM